MAWAGAACDATLAQREIMDDEEPVRVRDEDEDVESAVRAA